MKRRARTYTHTNIFGRSIKNSHLIIAGILAAIIILPGTGGGNEISEAAKKTPEVQAACSKKAYAILEKRHQIPLNVKSEGDAYYQKNQEAWKWTGIVRWRSTTHRTTVDGRIVCWYDPRIETDVMIYSDHW